METFLVTASGGFGEVVGVGVGVGGVARHMVGGREISLSVTVLRACCDAVILLVHIWPFDVPSEHEVVSLPYSLRESGRREVECGSVRIDQDLKTMP